MKRMYLSLTNEKTFDRVIKQLNDYKDGLDDKTQIFIQRLGQVGIKALNANLRSISPFYRGDVSTDSTLMKTESGWAVNLRMEGDQVLFIEFGAGITFNGSKGTSKHPEGARLGYTIGSYNPGSKNATNPNGWFYVDKWGKSQHTYGTPTFAPMYTSSLEVISVMTQIAQEVFGNG